MKKKKDIENGKEVIPNWVRLRAQDAYGNDDGVSELRGVFVNAMIYRYESFISHEDENVFKKRLPKSPYDWHQEAVTSGQKKLWNFFVTRMRTHAIQEEVVELRLLIEIPKDGLTDSEKGPDELLVDYEHKLNENHATWRYQSRIDAVYEWLYYMCISKFELNWWEWRDSFFHYLFFNIFIQPEHNIHLLCLKETKSIAESGQNPETYYSKTEVSERISYPISISISPYAGKRDILDFIEKMYPQINERQQIYRNANIKIGKYRGRKNRERDNYIYENRDLPIAKLIELVSSKFERLDHGAIGKLISEEEKRRK